ncbi:MAG TPA: 4Fe-4S dicluster domain-containing protein [Phycisphaerae bacterium]|nr:4Fe-4S dicluster domain-containing protein [Phycisphaerae bacterium]HOJ73795.1 4Fe-4S dicluster domain-containing protein [Phycisphaerae bacterium]HOM50442.1 4Fe-4S dicluster domain-containing protein [Phycisphaerae bacterium]HON65429.1 4Fe-4S dicluster domain-containing protein [Phycisphaerae bacterium]HOQ85702.1 4Fe-4S dicluster domain-containing protein [Phycisphaerae bacterium]
MLRILTARLRQGHRTIGYPDAPPVLPDRYRGLPVVNAAKCDDGCAKCAQACPTGAIDRRKGTLSLDMGKCLFCAACVEDCPAGAISFTSEHRMAVRNRADLIVSDRVSAMAAALDEKSRRLFGRSLKLRQVSAGGCNACEADLNVLSTVVYDLSRFGIQFVASPRHADGVVVTGPVTANMKQALLETYEAVPAPKIVIAVGACAISGGPYIGHPECGGGAAEWLPVDLFVPGCPPHPITILDGLLRLLGRMDDGVKAKGDRAG